jgi:CheY-like chemotaxis protein
MNLPVKDGWTTCKEVREDPSIAHTRIIALTAHAMGEDKARAMAAGCNDYATKPVDFPGLLKKISRLAAGDSEQ